MNQGKSIIIIPTYNEIENISLIIPKVLAQNPDYHVLVVDDHSPDGTAQKVKQMIPGYPNRVYLIERKGKLGLGTAYIAGFHFALQNGYSWVFEMDADFSHDPADLTRLQNALTEWNCHVTIGSRYVDKGGVKNWPLDRKLLSYGASLYVRLITFMNIKDPTAGFICYQTEVLKAMDLDKIRFIGYAFQIEMKYYAYQLGFRLKEVPIVFKDRVRGKSKMHGKIVFEAITGVLAMRFKALKGYYQRRKPDH
ncbi:MAG TPA: polyprenol monophosphomannose synthase [Saprospiraceae bacterium]|nr:polyprenol monophosphomannose synthase [Saprospiraceae bacterium]